MRRRQLVDFLRAAFKVDLRRSCRLLLLSRSVYYYRSCKDPDTALRLRLKELAAARPRYGQKRLYILLRREGWKINHKKVERIYREEGLSVRIKHRKKRASMTRAPFTAATKPNERWSMDFMADTLEDGTRIRLFTTVDTFTRESPVVAVDYRMNATKVIAALEQTRKLNGLPKIIRVDNGSEFYSRELDSWAYQNKVQLEFIRPGKPVENAFIESFNGKLRDECLNAEIFFSLNDARDKIEQWRVEYNQFRPHSALGGIPPSLFRMSLTENNTGNSPQIL